MRVSVVPAIGALLALAACGESNPVTSNDRSVSAIGPQMSVTAAASLELIQGQYVVMFRGNGIPASFASDVASRGGAILFSNSNVGIAAVTGLSETAAAGLAGRTDVQQVEQDVLLSLDPIDETSVEAAPDGIASPTSPSAAFFFPRQWNMRAVSANLAWSAGKLGSSGVTLAILDTGIDYTYPDLAGRVDLSRSTSFIPSDDATLAARFPGRHVITDMHFHGTHVASTAVSNSNVIAGVSTQTTLIGVKVCSRTGSCPSSAVLNGILYATDHGANVINMSLGGSFHKRIAGGFGSLINRVTNYAHRNGTLIVVAAGNENSDLQHNSDIYKTYCDSPNVVCVAATGPTANSGVNGPWVNVDARAGYSNFGRSAISVAAPGGTGAGFVWAACTRFSLIPQLAICATGTFILGATGTSMSTPHTSGLAALIAAQPGGASPSQIRARLQQSADDLGETGTDPFYGKGRINVARALSLN